MGFNNQSGVYSPASGSESAAAGQTIQSAVWNAINVDYAVNMRATSAMMTTTTGINFNTTGDTTLNVPLPTGYTNYIVRNLYISGASASLSSSKVGLFTAAGGAGTAIVAASTAVTITSTITNNSAMNFTIANQFTLMQSANPLFFRVSTVEGSAATATVSLEYTPVS